MSSFGFDGKKVFVYGLGVSGRVTAISLLEDGVDVYVWDDRNANRTPEMSGLENLNFVPPHEINWEDMAAMIKAPGIPMDMPAVKEAQKHHVPIMGDIDLLYRRNPNAQYIGITGTNGKSTSTALVTHILAKNGKNALFGGNIGTPVLSLPDVDKEGIYVLELSSYQLENLREMHLDAALLLNLTPDHLDRHGDIETYFKTKMRIFDRCYVETSCVMGVDEDILAQAALMYTSFLTVSVDGQKASYNVTRQGKFMENGKEIADLTYFDNLPGTHNWQNIACTYALTKKWLTNDEFFTALRSFVGLPHRMERVHDIGRIHFINDSKATNGEAAARSLNSFENVYWIVGGKPKADGLDGCKDSFHKVRAAFVIGEAEAQFVEELKDSVPVFACGNMETAIREAYAAAIQENLPVANIVLAPACASFDQFNSFEHRGDVFASLCRQITAPLEDVSQVKS